MSPASLVYNQWVFAAQGFSLRNRQILYPGQGLLVQDKDIKVYFNLPKRLMHTPY
jgi:hypothetical protein